MMTTQPNAWQAKANRSTNTRGHEGTKPPKLNPTHVRRIDSQSHKRSLGRPVGRKQTLRATKSGGKRKRRANVFRRDTKKKLKTQAGKIGLVERHDAVAGVSIEAYYYWFSFILYCIQW